MPGASRQASSLTQSPVSAEPARGAATACLDGPFANLTGNVGPGFTSEPRCVNRVISNGPSTQTGTAYVEAALDHSDYAGALDGIYLGPHLFRPYGAGHDGATTPPSPPRATPCFSCTTASSTSCGADWQARDEKRYTEISGPNAQDPDVDFNEIPGDMEEESKILWGKPGLELLAVTPDRQFGDGGPDLTLNHVMSSLGIIPNATVADVMDARGGFLCYEYV
ncbi:hypothetical protein VTG60DRAFT_6198 [Thermothelomyces hinnuleus]